jgi:hypothetical protein
MKGEIIRLKITIIFMNQFPCFGKYLTTKNI